MTARASVTPIFLISILFGIAASARAAVIFEKHSEEYVEGEIVPETRLRVDYIEMRVRLHADREEVSLRRFQPGSQNITIFENKTLLDIFEEQKSRIDWNSAAAVQDLARWCIDKCMPDLKDQSKQCHERVIEIDTDDPISRTALGYVRDGAGWELRAVTQRRWPDQQQYFRENLMDLSWEVRDVHNPRAEGVELSYLGIYDNRLIFRKKTTEPRRLPVQVNGQTITRDSEKFSVLVYNIDRGGRASDLIPETWQPIVSPTLCAGVVAYTAAKEVDNTWGYHDITVREVDGNEEYKLTDNKSSKCDHPLLSEKVLWWKTKPEPIFQALNSDREFTTNIYFVDVPREFSLFRNMTERNSRTILSRNVALLEIDPDLADISGATMAWTEAGIGVRSYNFETDRITTIDGNIRIQIESGAKIDGKYIAYNVTGNDGGVFVYDTQKREQIKLDVNWQWVDIWDHFVVGYSNRAIKIFDIETSRQSVVHELAEDEVLKFIRMHGPSIVWTQTHGRSSKWMVRMARPVEPQ
ncbi:MAG: hypothetical protein NUW37_18870 [Planctomycetes bacterium]|nr:hypothetical protein [Planctomycetota bacterium]